MLACYDYVFITWLAISSFSLWDDINYVQPFVLFFEVIVYHFLV